MLCKTYCATCIGLSAVTVTVETDISQGVGIHIVGLPDNAVRESLLRVITALRSYGFNIPGKKIVINLAPADIRKEGTAYDLAIALGMLVCTEQVPADLVESLIFMGELTLGGEIRAVPGGLPVAIHAKEKGFKGCVMPYESAVEAADIEEVAVYGVRRLSDVIQILSGEDSSHFLVSEADHPRTLQSTPVADFKNVKGQKQAKRGLEIAAAGGHNLILVGSPGCGKTFMASCLPSILPPMSREESIETSKIYSVAGRSNGEYGLLLDRPFRTPHHTASKVALIGGGQSAIPGEISLAHNGVLYLDEIAQFSRNTLDMLRQPLEDGRVSISRARYRVEYPSAFMLIASMNPCPCGYYGDPSGRCNCNPGAIANYMSRVSGPMMDRIDMHIYVERVSSEELTSTPNEEPSEAIAKRVAAAREIQLERFKNEGIFTNSRMNAEMIERYCNVGVKEREFLGNVIDRLKLSARSYVRTLKVARTIADLAGLPDITLQCISEAIQYRHLDRFLS